jgi:hypothetical protein
MSGVITGSVLQPASAIASVAHARARQRALDDDRFNPVSGLVRHASVPAIDQSAASARADCVTSAGPL